MAQLTKPRNMSHQNFVKHIEGLGSPINLTEYQLIIREGWDLYTFYEWLKNHSDSLVSWMACCLPILRLAIVDGLDTGMKNSSGWTVSMIALLNYTSLIEKMTDKFQDFLQNLWKRDIGRVYVVDFIHLISWDEQKKLIAMARIIKVLCQYGSRMSCES